MLVFNNKAICYNSTAINWVEPTNLPPYTLRLLFTDGYTPTFSMGTGVQVSSSPNIWDLTYINSDWNRVLKGQRNLIEVIDGNTSGVTSMAEMFSQNFIGSKLRAVSLIDTSNVTDMNNMFNLCDSLVSVPLFNTSKVTNMGSMFAGCNGLTKIPLFNTSKVTNMQSTFSYCHYVQSGALALYLRASTQSTPPANHDYTFKNCGDLTTTGLDELVQIPDDWK